MEENVTLEYSTNRFSLSKISYLSLSTKKEILVALSISVLNFLFFLCVIQEHPCKKN